MSIGVESSRRGTVKLNRGYPVARSLFESRVSATRRRGGRLCFQETLRGDPNEREGPSEPLSREFIAKATFFLIYCVLVEHFCFNDEIAYL